MSSQIGQLAQATAPSAEPYRRQIVGLPLQRSLFAQAAKAATTLGLPGLSSELDFPARLDENGDLFLDRSKVAALTRVLPSWFTPETLEDMHMKHAGACDDLVEVSVNAVFLAASLDGTSAGKVSEDLAHRIALVMAYGILSKFVPDVLLRTLAEAGDLDPPPFPEKSAGSGLMQNTFALYQACSALDYPPLRLQREWPRVSPKVFQLISDFCNRQRGFGPLAWDSPGYENPNYVVRLLQAAFNEVDPEQVRQRLSFANKPAAARSTTDVPKRTAALRRVLGFWLDFLERETWYVRQAFYVGMTPLLRRLAVEYQRHLSTFQVTDLLFFEVGELNGGTVDPAVIQTRRHRYWENSDYLSLQGIVPGQLAAMLGSS